MEKVLDRHDSLAKKIGTESALFGEGLWHGAIENPVNGVSQLANHVFNGHIPELHLVDESKVHNTMAGKIGEGVGKVVDIAAVSFATAGIGDVIAGTAGFALTPLRLAIGYGTYKAVFEPTDKKEKNFYESRAKAGAVGAISGYLGGSLVKRFF